MTEANILKVEDVEQEELYVCNEADRCHGWTCGHKEPHTHSSHCLIMCPRHYANCQVVPQEVKSRTPEDILVEIRELNNQIFQAVKELILSEDGKCHTCPTNPACPLVKEAIKKYCLECKLFPARG